MSGWTTALMRRRWVQRLRYEAIYAWPGWRDVSSFNGGYWPVNPDIAQDPAFAAEPNQIQLYAELFDTAGLRPGDLAGVRVLEVAAGRGGGLAYVRRRFSPAELVGVELTASGVRHGRGRGLSMVRGKAQALPFEDGRFDLAYLLDSFFHLAERDRILPQMHRVLRPGGRALVGDFILATPEEAASEMRSLAGAAGFEVETLRDVSGAVAASFEHDHARKLALLQRLPRLLRPWIAETLTLKGTARYEEWRTGRRSYVLAALRPADARGA